MENDPKTLLKQLISNLELAEMRARQLYQDPGFSYSSRMSILVRLAKLMHTEAVGVMEDAFPAGPEGPAVVLYEPLELDCLDWKLEQKKLLEDQQMMDDLTKGLGVPKEYYEPPTHSE